MASSGKSPVEEVQKHIAMEVTTLLAEASKEIPIRSPAEFFMATTHNKTVRDPWKQFLVGGWATPLKNMKVNWDD